MLKYESTKKYRKKNKLPEEKNSEIAEAKLFLSRNECVELLKSLNWFSERVGSSVQFKHGVSATET